MQCSRVHPLQCSSCSALVSTTKRQVANKPGWAEIRTCLRLKPHLSFTMRMNQVHESLSIC